MVIPSPPSPRLLLVGMHAIRGPCQIYSNALKAETVPFAHFLTN